MTWQGNHKIIIKKRQQSHGKENMIRFAVIYRAHDGLALSASTDLDSSLDLIESKKCSKLLSKKARQFPTKCFMNVGNFIIYFLTENDICCLMICEKSYAAVLAFSFLDDIKREFLQQYPKASIEKAVRPYSFIEFDNFLQRTKQKYNNPRSLTVRIDIGQLTQELQRDPPYNVSEADLGTKKVNLNAPVTIKGNPHKLVPLSWFGIAACCLCLLCCLMNLVRVIPFISEHGNEPQEETGWVVKALSLLLSGILNGCQCYILLNPIRWRQQQNVTVCILSILIGILLRDLRNSFEMLLHIAVVISTALQIWNRPLQEKLPDYNV